MGLLLGNPDTRLFLQTSSDGAPMISGGKLFHWLIVLPKSFVEINHCMDVPCRFTIPEWYSKSSEPFYIYWFKNVYKRYYLRWINLWVLGVLMVSNDSRQRPDPTNFKLIGNINNGDCSFSIYNAQLENSGRYYMRIDKGEASHQHFSCLDVKKPVIWKPSSIIWGETINFSCVASNCCLKPKPQIIWSSKSSDWNISEWGKQISNWTWTYGANLSFVPILANEGLILTCHLKYPDTRKDTQNAVQLHMAFSIHYSLSGLQVSWKTT
uniref:Ig-like domain-containing protein n=1 Tax=Laticauda laticaudata TaxID=8630 RepID=A0A8C5SHF4_LATLA